jgi:tetratricopeptide (TPR) repeat protein
VGPSPHLLSGEASLATGEALNAERDFRAALGESPGDPRALLGLARAQLALAEAGLALSTFDDLADRHPAYSRDAVRAERCEALLRAARRRMELDQSEAALALVSGGPDRGCARAELSPLRARALVREGERARESGQSSQAVDRFRAAAKADPSSSEAFAAAAELLAETGRRDEAISLLFEALHLHPQDRRLQELMVGALGIRYSEPASGLSTGAAQPGEDGEEQP